LDWLCRSGIVEWFETSTRFSNFRRGFYDPAKTDISAISEYLRPLKGNINQRRAFRLFLLAGDSSYTEQAIPGIKSFEKPTLIVWSGGDKYLPPALGQRLFDDIPGARRFELVTGCGHFWPEECPAEFSDIIEDFLKKHLAGYADRQ
jgi:pimeloyl-ACP methyl ester carboxylesterase